MASRQESSRIVFYKVPQCKCKEKLYCSLPGLASPYNEVGVQCAVHCSMVYRLRYLHGSTHWAPNERCVSVCVCLLCGVATRRHTLSHGFIYQILVVAAASDKFLGRFVCLRSKSVGLDSRHRHRLLVGIIISSYKCLFLYFLCG